MSSSVKVINPMKMDFHESGYDKQPDCRMVDLEEKLEYGMDYLTPAMIEEARTQLRETPEIKAKALEDLRALIKKEKNLVVPMDDDFLVMYLRSRKFNVKRAFKVLQNYWIFRRDHRSIFDTSDADRVKKLIMKSFLGFLPYRDQTGCIVMVLKVGLWNPEVDSFEEMFRAISAILIDSIQNSATQICGYRIIFDCRDLSWKQLKMCTPANIILMIHSTQYCFPARYKGFHFLSENKLFNLAWAIAHPFLTPKLKKRIYLHGSDLKPLLDYIHPSVLPVEYGGEAPVFDNSGWKEIMDQNTEKVLEQLKYGYKD